MAYSDAAQPVVGGVVGSERADRTGLVAVIAVGGMDALRGREAAKGPATNRTLGDIGVYRAEFTALEPDQRAVGRIAIGNGVAAIEARGNRSEG